MAQDEYRETLQCAARFSKRVRLPFTATSKFLRRYRVRFEAESAASFEGRELPHARKERAIAVVLPNQQRAALRVQQHGGRQSDFSASLAFCAAREVCSAMPSFRARHHAGDGTFPASGRLRRANRRSQLHHGLIPVARSVAGEQILRCGFEFPPQRRSAQIAAHGSDPREHARHISVQHRQRLVVSDAQNCGSRVTSDARKGQRCFIAREEIGRRAG